MSPQFKKEYVEAIRLRYKTASRHGKIIILDEFCITYKCHRKHAIMVLRKSKNITKTKLKRRGKRPIYQNRRPVLHNSDW